MKHSLLKSIGGFAPFLITVALAAVVFAFAGPGSAPPNGSGSVAISSGASPNVSIGGVPNADKLSVNGDVQWTGFLNAGSVPWARLTQFPTACSSGWFATGIAGVSLPCAQPDFNKLTGTTGFSDNTDNFGSGGISSVAAGNGLTVTASGNPITTTGTLSVNTGLFQNRVLSCTAGNAISSIAADGSVTCKSMLPATPCTWNDKNTYVTGNQCYNGGVQTACFGSPNYDSWHVYTCQANGTWTVTFGVCSPRPTPQPRCG